MDCELPGEASAVDQWGGKTGLGHNRLSLGAGGSSTGDLGATGASGLAVGAKITAEEATIENEYVETGFELKCRNL